MYERRTSQEEETYFFNKNEGAFHLAWRRILSSQILDTKDRLSNDIYSARTEEHIQNLLTDLNNEAYKPHNSAFIYSPKLNGRLRIRSMLDMRDRLVYQAIGNIIIENCYEDLAPFADKTIFAHIPNPPKRDGGYSDFTFLPIRSRRGIEGQYSKFQRVVMRDVQDAVAQFKWMLETDITAFYPSLDHKLIIEMLERRGWLNSEYLRQLLFTCLSQWSEHNDAEASQGVPVGYETSELLATLFLLDIDFSMGKEPPVLRRFVDDTFVFFDTEQALMEWFVTYDLALKHRALLLNSKKTKIVQCTIEDFNQKQFEKHLSERRSLLNFVLENGIDEEKEKAQIELIELLRSTQCSDSCDESSIECIENNLTTISYVLYRTRFVLDSIARIALCVLHEFPIRSFQATEYLARCYGDDIVISNLWHYAVNERVYTSRQIDCMKALIKLNRKTLTDDMVSLLIQWLNRDDNWQLQASAIELLSEHDKYQVDTFMKLASESNSPLIRSMCIDRVFEHAVKDADRELGVESINRALADDVYTVQALGVYLLRRTTTISHKDLDTSNMPSNLEHLIIRQRDINQFEIFSERFEDIFGFSIPTNISLIRQISDVEMANQCLRNIQDGEHNRIAYVKALHEFMRQFLVACIRTSENRVEDIIFADVLRYIYRDDSHERSAIHDLMWLHGQALQGNWGEVTYDERNRAYENMRHVVAEQLHSILTREEFEISDELEKYVAERTGRMRDTVFISYAHADYAKDPDPNYLELLNKNLNPLTRYRGLKVWYDENMETGDKWRDKIREKLATTKVAVLLVTPNFLVSEFILNKELPDFLRAHEEEGLTIFWINVIDNNYHVSPIEPFNCANDIERPLESLEPHELSRIVRDISRDILRAWEK